MSSTHSALPMRPAQAGPLAEMAKAAAAAIERGENAQVVFDLDDTLFLVRPRKRVIFRELAELHTQDLTLHTALHRLADSPIPYDVREALGTVGIAHPPVVEQLQSGFFERFFNGDYAQHDLPNEGAAAYVNYLYAMGVKIVYLSGRPEEMMAGTVAYLAEHGFPVGANTSVVLKKREEMHLGDAEFKGVKAYDILQDGPIFGVFDNEPANLNAMHPAAPEAWYFLMDTDHSPNPPEPAMAVHVMSQFEMVQRLNKSLAASPTFAQSSGWSLEVSVQGA